MKNYNPTHPIPSLVISAEGHKSVEWLTENEREDWSLSADIACIVAAEATGVFAYKNGVKYDESGDIVSRYDFKSSRGSWLS